MRASLEQCWRQWSKRRGTEEALVSSAHHVVPDVNSRNYVEMKGGTNLESPEGLLRGLSTCEEREKRESVYVSVWQCPSLIIINYFILPRCMSFTIVTQLHLLLKINKTRNMFLVPAYG